jgi:hypothetical protein
MAKKTNSNKTEEVVPVVDAEIVGVDTEPTETPETEYRPIADDDVVVVIAPASESGLHKGKGKKDDLPPKNPVDVDPKEEAKKNWKPWKM